MSGSLGHGEFLPWEGPSELLALHDELRKIGHSATAESAVAETPKAGTFDPAVAIQHYADPGFTAALTSLVAHVGVTGVRTSEIISWRQFLGYVTGLFNVATQQKTVATMVIDLHGQVAALSKRERKRRRVGNAPKFPEISDRSIYLKIRARAGAGVRTPDASD